ncbi:MAG: hypothetical protein MJY83_06135, partial [Bacteroidales bacterium]|nr:hypothetical protein [Bacteroidales bacterium]
EANFKNLCGLLRLTLKGSGTIKKIRIIDDAPLYGEIARIADDGSAVLKSAGLSEYALTHDCGAGVDLSADGTNFYIPMPQGDYDGIKIEITDRLDRTITKTLKAGKILNITRSKITPVSLTLAGFEVDPLPDGALSGAFTVSSSGRRVFFSRGNLYWDGDSFEFEAHQYDSPDKWKPDHVSFYYWSVTASYAYNSTYTNEVSPEDVLFTNDPNHPEKPNKNFTVNNVTGAFRTLSNDEWHYLITKHDVKYVTINDRKGYVIAPDGVKLDPAKESYSEIELVSDNLVFLGCNGLRRWDATHFYNDLGYYWSSSIDKSDNSHALSLSINNNEIKTGVSLNRADERACIRLVTDVALESSDIEKPEEGNTYDWD